MKEGEGCTREAAHTRVPLVKSESLPLSGVVALDSLSAGTECVPQVACCLSAQHMYVHHSSQVLGRDDNTRRYKRRFRRHQISNQTIENQRRPRESTGEWQFPAHKMECRCQRDNCRALAGISNTLGCCPPCSEVREENPCPRKSEDHKRNGGL